MANLGYPDQLNIIVNAAKTGLATITEGHTITFDHGAQIIYAGGAAYDFHTLTKAEYDRLINVIGATGSNPQSLEAVVAELASHETAIAVNASGISALWEGLSGIVATGNETHNQLWNGISGINSRFDTYKNSLETNLGTELTGIQGRIATNHTGIVANASGIAANASAISALHNQTVELDKATGYLTLSTSGTYKETYTIHQDALTQKLESLTSAIDTLSNGESGLSTVLTQIQHIKDELYGVTGAEGEYLNTLLDALTTLQLRNNFTGVTNYKGIQSNLNEGTDSLIVPLQTSLKHLADNISGNSAKIANANTSVANAITGVYTGLNAKIINNYTGIVVNASGIAANASAISALQSAVDSKYNQTVTGTTGLVTVTSYGDHNENYVINQSLLNTKLDDLTNNLNNVITWEIVGAGS